MKLYCTTNRSTPNGFLSQLLFSILTVTSFSGYSTAQPGSLDTSFGINGIRITALDDFNDRANAVAIQNDGKILLAGFTQSSFTSSDFALLRFNTDGTADATFGTDGTVITSIEDRTIIFLLNHNIMLSAAHTLFIQEDGKILQVGYLSTVNELEL